MVSSARRSNSIGRNGSTNCGDVGGGAALFRVPATSEAVSAAPNVASVYRRKIAYRSRAGVISGIPRTWPARSAYTTWNTRLGGYHEPSDGNPSTQSFPGG